MKLELNRFDDEILQAQASFDNQLDLQDRSGLIATTNVDKDLLSRSNTRVPGLYELAVAPHELKGIYAPLIGRMVLMPNIAKQELSPAVIMPHGNDFELTMLDVPYDTQVGLSDGYKFALSAQAQTRTTGFGGHGNAGPLESGHFGTLLVGARDKGVGSNIVTNGDTATHRVIQGGVANTMQSVDMLPVGYRSRVLPAAETRKITLFWHEGLDGATGPEAADYPNAVRLMLGAGVAALGVRGLDKARQLVDYAREGMGS